MKLRAVVRAVKGQVRARLSVEERRRQLIDLGLALFSSRSYDEISMEEIARASGVSKGLVFHYFPTKRDLYVAALEEASRLLLLQIQTDAAHTPEEQLRSALDAYLGFVGRRARAFVALMRGGMGTDAEVARVLEGTRQEICNRILQALKMDGSNAELRAMLRGWVGFVEAISLDWVQHKDLQREELRDRCVEVLGFVLMRHT